MTFLFRLTLALTLAAGVASAQTLEQIMAHPDWLGRQPENPYWADDGGSIYYERKVEGTEERLLYQVALDGTGTRVVPESEKATTDFPGGAWSSDRTRKVYSRNGDLFVHDVTTGSFRQLTRTRAEDTDPRFMVGDERVVFYRGDDIFVRELETGLEYEPAVVFFEDDPAEEEDESYLERQQRRLIDHVRQEEEKEDAARERDRRARQEDPSRVPAPFYLGDEDELKASSLSPSGRWMLLLLLPKDRDEGDPDTMPSYVTESAFVESEEVRPLVGTHTPVSDKVVLLDLQDHTRTDISFETLPGIHDDPLAEIRKSKEDQGDTAENGGDDEEAEKARPVYVGSSTFGSSPRAGILWSSDGEHLVVDIYSHDHKDRWIAEIELESGTLRLLDLITDEAWINWRLNEIGFLPDAPTLFYTSEASGYAQLYLRPLDADSSTRLTEGDFVVSDVVESPDGRYLYYTANVEHPGIYETYRYDLRDERTEQVSDLGGRNAFLLSPDGERVLLTHSTTTMPPELYVQEAGTSDPSPEDAVRVTETVSPLFLSFSWVEPEIVPVPSTHHDRPIYSRLYRPAGEVSGRRPAVVFVHGAGYLQNAHLGWSSYFREFMFHTLLVQRGYVVLDMDYRASAGYGRDWRTAIYRQMGTPELEDLEDGVRYLAENENVDPERVGVYGGSYGGFITFMSLFKKPDLFACGAALRPVTDWAHYNHPYTSRILNTPSVDPEAYERSSPIELAEGLTKPLLIAHGMLDDNVLFKDSVRLTQRLIELEKTDWETAIYPVEPHGFREPSSWLDEYRRVYELFEENLK